MIVVNVQRHCLFLPAYGAPAALLALHLQVGSEFQAVQLDNLVVSPLVIFRAIPARHTRRSVGSEFFTAGAGDAVTTSATAIHLAFIA
ncbi:hypothetical protein [Glutamicibacter soli]|uniref:hypothetical protein n=1 Tax=Glutamicibacter soli TaxID=453836 RepID=UPI001FD518EF|nr:hypothetical protein [Glutamicibacter soli]